MSAPQTGLLNTALRRLPRPWRGALLPLAALALWWWAAHAGISRSPLLVPPEAVWQRAVQLWGDGTLPQALRASLWRDVQGLALGVAAGLVLGAALGLSRWAERLVAPSLNALKQISLFAWLPLLSVWFGLGDAAKVAFLALAAFFPMALNTFEGIRSVPLEYIEVARVLRFSRWQWLTQVVLPAAAPSLIAGLNLALIYAWLGTLGAEYLLTSGKGVANLLLDGREHFQMDLVLLGMVVVAGVGFLMGGLAQALERRSQLWRAQPLARR